LNSDWSEADKRKIYIDEEYVQKGLGIFDATDEELQLLLDNQDLAVNYFADMISRRAQIGWSTHGHSAVDVNIYGSGAVDALRGNHENTDVGKFLREYLDVDVDAITRELNAKSKSFSVTADSQVGWTGRIPTAEDLKSSARQHEDFTVMDP
jgi:alkaline phosphatase